MKVDNFEECDSLNTQQPLRRDYGSWRGGLERRVTYSDANCRLTQARNFRRAA